MIKVVLFFALVITGYYLLWLAGGWQLCLGIFLTTWATNIETNTRAEKKYVHK